MTWCNEFPFGIFNPNPLIRRFFLPVLSDSQSVEEKYLEMEGESVSSRWFPAHLSASSEGLERQSQSPASGTGGQTEFDGVCEVSQVCVDETRQKFHTPVLLEGRPPLPRPPPEVSCESGGGQAGRVGSHREPFEKQPLSLQPASEKSSLATRISIRPSVI